MLSSYGIKSNGLAEGDLKIGKYVSLRNEAFVMSENGNYIYPPNDVGWNSLSHELPINLQKLMKLIEGNQKIENPSKPMYYFLLPMFFLSFGLWIVKKVNVSEAL